MHSDWKSEDRHRVADFRLQQRNKKHLIFKMELQWVCERVIDRAAETEGDWIPGLCFSVHGKAVLLKPSQIRTTTMTCEFFTCAPNVMLLHSIREM